MVEQYQEHECKAKRLKTAVDEDAGEDESTDYKLAILASLHPDKSAQVHLDYLLAYGGSTYKASAALRGQGVVQDAELKRKKPTTIGYQSSLHAFASKNASGSLTTASSPVKPLTKKGKILHLYSPEDIEAHTPCK